MKPLAFARNRSRGYHLVAASWILALIYALPVTFFTTIKEIDGLPQCWIDLDNFGWRIYLIYLTSLLLIIPTLIIAICYVHIVYTIWSKVRLVSEQQQQRRRQQEASSKALALDQALVTESAYQRPERADSAAGANRKSCLKANLVEASEQRDSIIKAAPMRPSSASDRSRQVKFTGQTTASGEAATGETSGKGVGSRSGRRFLKRILSKQLAGDSSSYSLPGARVAKRELRRRGQSQQRVAAHIQMKEGQQIFVQVRDREEADSSDDSAGFVLDENNSTAADAPKSSLAHSSSSASSSSTPTNSSSMPTSLSPSPSSSSSSSATAAAAAAASRASSLPATRVANRGRRQSSSRLDTQAAQTPDAARGDKRAAGDDVASAERAADNTPVLNSTQATPAPPGQTVGFKPFSALLATRDRLLSPSELTWQRGDDLGASQERGTRRKASDRRATSEDLAGTSEAAAAGGSVRHALAAGHQERTVGPTIFGLGGSRRRFSTGSGGVTDADSTAARQARPSPAPGQTTSSQMTCDRQLMLGKNSRESAKLKDASASSDGQATAVAAAECRSARPAIERERDFVAQQHGSGMIPKARIKTIKMTLVIVIAYILCWSPFLILNLCGVFGLIKNDTSVSHALLTLTQSLAHLNSAVNPIIFWLFSSKRNNANAQANRIKKPESNKTAATTTSAASKGSQIAPHGQDEHRYAFAGHNWPVVGRLLAWYSCRGPSPSSAAAAEAAAAAQPAADQQMLDRAPTTTTTMTTVSDKQRVCVGLSA